MARQSFQRGFVRLRKRKRRKQCVGALLSGSQREVENGVGCRKARSCRSVGRKKEDLEVLDQRMTEISSLNQIVGSLDVICLERRFTASTRLTSKRQSLDTGGSALTGRHQPAARENSHLFGLSRVRVHLLSAWLQRGTGDS